ncbi:MAG: CBS domain-containing protein [Rhodocyclales bacterium]|nr:CBS domain-containing protein [Rhodocyclales bacterium]
MRATSRLTLHSQLAALVRRKPVTAAPETSLREAVQSMAEYGVGSIVVVEPESGRPVGIFTLRDLRRCVADAAFDLDRMLLSVMSQGELLVLNWRATIYQAALVMARHDVHHVIIVDASGRMAGVVSQDDIYELQSGGGKAISGAIRNARDLEGLVAAADDIRRLAERMLREGAAAEPLTQLISSLNDHLTVRVVELTQHEFVLPKVRWCWLSFGSEGRFEQTLATDQDNGIVFAAPRETAATVRAAFLPFARAVNQRLAACGFPLCKGNVMAGNPDLCLALDEWKDKFHAWLQAASPKALLNATIYFDFRPLYGEEALTEDLRTWLLGTAVGGPLFLRFMAENALRVAPPLGLVRDFAFDKDGEFPHTLDLKASGARLFVDVARILALANGVDATNTAERLRALAARGKLGRDDVGALVDGFYFIQLLRLRQQQEGVAAGMENRIDPDRLNELDRLILKQAFKQAKKLQSRLQLEYRL